MSKRYSFDWKACAIFLLVSSVFAYLISLAGINFWVAFCMIAFAMLVNGLIATAEDEKPGGFNNPHQDNKG